MATLPSDCAVQGTALDWPMSHAAQKPDPADGGERELPVLRPQLPTAERVLPYLARIDASRCYTNWGPLTTEFEQRLAALFRQPSHAVVSASSGTMALVGAILATAGPAHPERPIAFVPALTFAATALAVQQCGYRVHLVDVDAGDWLLHAHALEHHPLLDRVGLVVPVACHGRRVSQEEWRLFERGTGVPVVIDGAAAFECVETDPHVMLGPVPVTLSFHATKSFACGEGGVIVTSDAERSRAVIRALNFGFFEDRRTRCAATNGKLSEYHAAVGLAELDGWTVKREALMSVAARYREQMHAAGLGGRMIVAPAVASCYALYHAASQVEAATVTAALHAAKIGVRSWYGPGLHAQPWFERASADALPVTGGIGPRLVGLPVAPDLTVADIARVTHTIASCFTRTT